ncbi:hypothetical protein [Haloferax sp. DFSO52]|uniref:DUF7289 family protein n=1 Tax=Haloferax sp. DFSO52 TaxID=3388505 RepID=UPI003A83C5CF
MTDTRGSSELLSFVLVFALVITTVALVFALGYPALLHVQDVERSTNAERSMTTVADTVTELTVRGVPSRATEVKLSEASLSFGDPVTVTVKNESGGVLATETLRPLVYDGSDGTRITYVGGAVFREQADGGFVVVRDPEVVASEFDDTVVLVPVTKAASSTDSVAGQTDVLIRLERGATRTNTTSGGVEVSLVSPSPEMATAWRAYFESQPGVTGCSVSGTTTTCTFDGERSSVTFVDVVVELE